MAIRTPAALLTFAVLSGCAIVSYDLSPEASACKTPEGKIELSFRRIQTVRGSFHTPFDYGNKSTASWLYVVRFPSAEIADWYSSDLEIRSEGSPLTVTKGTVGVKSRSIYFNITVAPLNAKHGDGTTISEVLPEWGSIRLSQATACAPR